MTSWLLEDGPLGTIGHQFDPSWSWPADTIHVVHDVAEAAKNDKSGRRQALLALGGAMPAVRVHRPLSTSPAAIYLLGHLRPRAPSATKNLGEDVAIALAATDFLDAVFVTMDKAAAFIAIAELGPGRVSTPLDVWYDLQRRDLISTEQRDTLVQRTVGQASLPGVPRRFAP